MYIPSSLSIPTVIYSLGFPLRLKANGHGNDHKHWYLPLRITSKDDICLREILRGPCLILGKLKLPSPCDTGCSVLQCTAKLHCAYAPFKRASRQGGLIASHTRDP